MLIEMENSKTIIMGRYEREELLGRGAFAKVYLARSLTTGQSVAIKILYKDLVCYPRHEEQIIREITAMRLVKHPNVVELFEVMASTNRIYLVLEYAKGGGLFDKIAKGKLEEDAARRYFQQLISAVDYCHSRGVYHRDLKPRNLLLDENGNLKVSDFGLSAIVDRRKKNVLLETPCGTRAYTAPEVIKKHEYDGAKADIWSCGVILFVLLAGRNPFQDDNLLEMYKKILNSKYKCPKWFSFEVQKLIAMMLNPDPRFRYPIAKIREYPWFREGLEASNSSDTEEEQDSINILHLNAFYIISAGFDLSSLFDDGDLKKELWFTTTEPAPAIISQLENMANSLELNVRYKAGAIRLEGSKEGRKGVLAIDVEIIEFTPSFHTVEMKKSNGDTLEYQKLLKEGIRPALKDIVWAWQDDQQQQQQQS